MDRQATRWLSVAVPQGADVRFARAGMRAWAAAVASEPATRNALAALVLGLLERAHERGEVTIDFGWITQSRPTVELELAEVDAASVAATAPASAPGLDLEVVRERVRDRGLASLRVSTETRASVEAVERALSTALKAEGAAAVEESLSLGRALAAQRARELELSAALEEARRRADAAEGAALRLAAQARKQDELLAVAAHDVRSPVAAAKGALELLEPMLTTLTDDQRHLLHVARRACDAVVHLSSNLLATALVELEDDDGPASDPVLDLAALARDVAELVEVEARRKGVRLEVTVDDDVPSIRADPMWATRIVSNVLSNGLKYVQQGGHVWVHVGARAGRAVLTVDDDGVGIPADKSGRVFERLTKIRPRGTAGERGSGIGLYVVKQLVDRLGGTLSFAPREPAGTRFVVELPAARQEPAAPRDERAEPPAAVV